MCVDQQVICNRKINLLITKRIFELQEQGYVYDFGIKDALNFTCLQNELVFSKQDTMVKLIDLHYDQISRGFTYIHSVDTFHGYKGIMLSNRIFCNNNWQ